MRAPAAFFVVAALALGGCGGSDPSDEDQVRKAISSYYEALGGDEPEKVCDLLVTARGELPPPRCRKRMARVPDAISVGLPLKVRSVRVRGAGATAALEDGERVRLRRVDDAWRIVAPG
ncbi:MAG TPA: hypothetical protein VFY44_12375 [Thermoleophilaceae bacterium]|nr:hypothetical protein [Thermoleophilaceae bacterium]